MEIASLSQFYNEFKALLTPTQSVLLMSHKNPDDDSISSVLTVYTFLQKEFPQIAVDIVYSGEKNDRWKYFEYFDKIQFLEEDAIHFEQYDMFIGVDADQYSRFVQNTELLSNYEGKIVLIDHHNNPADRNDLSIVRFDYPACAALLYDILYLDRPFSTERLPQTIILGILGDTGNFRFIKPNQTNVFLIAERLVREGNFDIQDLLSKYMGYSEKIAVILQEFVKNMQFHQIAEWPRFMYSSLRRGFIQEHSLSDVDISSASGIFVGQYGTSIAECSWSMVFSARTDGSVSVSMRSRPGSVNVRLLGQEMGVGGGHDRAGGLKFSPSEGKPADVDESIQKVFAWMQEHVAFIG